ANEAAVLNTQHLRYTYDRGRSSGGDEKSSVKVYFDDLSCPQARSGFMKRSKTRRGVGGGELPASPQTPPVSPRRSPDRPTTPRGTAASPTHGSCEQIRLTSTPSTPVTGNGARVGSARRRRRTRSIGMTISRVTLTHTPKVAAKRFAGNSGA
ncbi:unnamed protein product, partial [Pylaiella littoralis]